MAPRKKHRDFKSRKNFHHQDVKNSKKSEEFCECSSSDLAYNRKDRIHRVRTRNKKLNIPKLVYKFLGNVASLESENNETKMKCSSLKRSVNKNSKNEQRYPDTVHIASKSFDESRTSISTSKSNETNSTICTIPSTPATKNSGIKTSQKFSIQAIKDYIKAGIAEGKRRAKRYMCKALSFGVDTGYLIPTDSDGQVLRVSSALISFTTQKDNGKDGDRGIRQKLRRGDAACTSEERKVLRRREDASVSKKRPRSPSSIPSSTSSTKRTTRPKTKKPKYGKRIKKHRTRSSKKVKLKRGSGRPKNRISSAKIKAEKSCPDVKNEDKQNDDTGGETENLHEETLTPSRSEEDNAKSIKKENPSDPSIEENGSEGTDVKEK